MLMTAYLLFMVSTGEMPILTAIGTYPDEAACRTARTEVAELLKRGRSNQGAVCVSQESLGDLATTNKFQDQTDE